MNGIIIIKDIVVANDIYDTLQDMRYIRIQGIFDNLLQGMNYLQMHEVDVVIVATDALGQALQDGFSGMVREFRSISKTRILYVEQETAAWKSLQYGAGVFLVPPLSSQKIIHAMETAILLAGEKSIHVYARTFGRFDLFINDTPIVFRSQKAKELLAFLVDHRGGVVNNDEIIDALWPGREKDDGAHSLCSKLCKTLHEELEEYELGNLVQSNRGCHNIELDMFSCDLYELLQGNEHAKREYFGEYMMGYEWAEYRNYTLGKYM